MTFILYSVYEYIDIDVLCVSMFVQKVRV